MRRAIFTSTALKALHREHELAVVKQAQQHAACDLGIMADWQAHASLRSPIADTMWVLMHQLPCGTAGLAIMPPGHMGAASRRS